MGNRAQRTKERFFGIPLWIVRHPAWYQLTGDEVRLLVYLHSHYNGKNNGDFSCVWNDMKSKGWKSPTTLHKAKQGLLAKGWIEETRKGYTKCCSLYAVTWEAIDDCSGKLDIRPTNRPSMLFKKNYNH